LSLSLFSSAILVWILSFVRDLTPHGFYIAIIIGIQSNIFSIAFQIRTFGGRFFEETLSELLPSESSHDALDDDYDDEER
jgi:hypothetical protein